MKTRHETQDSNPPDTLLAVLDTIDEWQNGGLIQYGPEGLAILQRLQAARIGTKSLSATVEVTV